MLLLFLTLDEMNTTISVVKFQSLKKGKKFHLNFTHKCLEVSISFIKFQYDINCSLVISDPAFVDLAGKKMRQISNRNFKIPKMPLKLRVKFRYKFHKVSTETL